MNQPSFLGPDEIALLTAKQRRRAQVKALNAMGIEHKVRPDGSLAILRSHIEKVFAGSVDMGKLPRSPTVAPNWAAI